MEQLGYRNNRDERDKITFKDRHLFFNIMLIRLLDVLGNCPFIIMAKGLRKIRGVNGGGMRTAKFTDGKSCPYCGDTTGGYSTIWYSKESRTVYFNNNGDYKQGDTDDFEISKRLHKGTCLNCNKTFRVK